MVTTTILNVGSESWDSSTGPGKMEGDVVKEWVTKVSWDPS